MCKKVFSVILAFALFLGILPVQALTDGIVVSDNFDGAALGPVSLSGGYQNDVWAMTHENSWKYAAGGIINQGFYTNQSSNNPNISLSVEKEGTNQYMAVTHLQGFTGVCMKRTPFHENPGYDTVYAAFKFRIPRVSGATSSWALAINTPDSSSGDLGSRGLLSFNPNGKIYSLDTLAYFNESGIVGTYSHDTWYTALYRMQVTNTETNQVTVSVTVYGPEGCITETVSMSSTKFIDNKRGPIPVVRVYNPNKGNLSGSVIHLDDSSLLGVNSATDEVRLIESSIVNGTEITSRNPAIDLTFSRPLCDVADGDIIFSDDSNPIKITRTDYNKLRITFTNQLFSSTEYTLDFSRVKDVLGHQLTGTDSITFRTKTMPLTLLPAETPVSVEGNIFYSRELNFPVVNHVGEDIPATLFLAIYRNNQLIGLQRQDTEIAKDAKKVTISFPDRYHDVTGVKLMIFNNLESLQPLAEPCLVEFQETAPIYHVDNYPKKQIFKQNFEGGALPNNVRVSQSYNVANIDSSTGYGGGSSYKVQGAEKDKSDKEGGTTLAYTVSGLNLEAGSAIVMSAMMKAENLNGNTGVRTTMDISNSTTGQTKSVNYTDEIIRGTKDWTESKQYVTCDFPVDTVRVSCYLDGTVTAGTAWYDEISLYQVGFDPFLEAVLESPSYKGFIYGEGGEGDIILSTSVKDYGGIYDLSNCVVRADIVNKQDITVLSAELTEVEEEIRISFSSKHLTMGEDYYLQLSLNNPATGEQYSFREWILRKRPADYRPDNYFDEYGRFVVDGKPSFLMGIYGENDLESAINDMADTPINVLFSYGYLWIPLDRDATTGNPITGADQELLDLAEEKGIKLVAPLKNYYYSKVKSTGFSNIIKEPKHSRMVFEGFAEALDHPAVLGYYMADELSSERDGAEVEWANRILSSADPDGFTFNVFSSSSDSRAQLRFADVANSYIYALEKGNDLSKVAKTLSNALDHVPAGNRPFLGVLQSTAITAKGPTESELRNMAWQAVCAGMQGIIWYNYFQMKDDSDFDSQWASLVKVCEELENYYPVILSNEAAPYIETESGDWFTSIAKRYNGKSYLFTTNTSREEQVAKIRVENATSVKGVYSGETYTPDSNGFITVTYPPIGVEVLEIVQEDYLSPQAQLFSIGFSNSKAGCFITNTDTGLKLYVPELAATVTYAAKISEGASLYLNEKKVPTQGTITLNGLTELNVKVVSEDGRFKTERKYHIVRN